MFIPLYCVLTWSTLIIKKYSCQFIFRIVVGFFFLYLNKSIMFVDFDWSVIVGQKLNVDDLGFQNLIIGGNVVDF
jgi:hypothetical protein